MVGKYFDVAHVGRDDAGAFVDGRCGEEPIRKGDTLSSGDGVIVVTVERIRAYGHDLAELSPALTARLWIRGAAAHQLNAPILLYG